MAHGMKPESQLERSALRKWAAIIALLAFAVFALVQVVHFHPDEADHSNCSLCLSTHCMASATQASTAPIIAFVLLAEAACRLQLVSRLYLEADSIRPPPVAV